MALLPTLVPAALGAEALPLLLPLLGNIAGCAIFLALMSAAAAAAVDSGGWCIVLGTGGGGGECNFLLHRNLCIQDAREESGT